MGGSIPDLSTICCLVVVLTVELWCINCENVDTTLEIASYSRCRILQSNDAVSSKYFVHSFDSTINSVV